MSYLDFLPYGGECYSPRSIDKVALKEAGEVDFWTLRVKEYPDHSKVYQYIPWKVAVGAIGKPSKGLCRSRDRSKECAYRAYTKIYDLLRCGSWSWFVTLTIDPSLYDSTSYDVASMLLTRFLGRIRHKYKNVMYLFVYELTKNGAYHFHGLMSGCDDEFIPSFDRSGRRRCDNKGRPVYNARSWDGGAVTSVTRVSSSARAASYVSKYLLKEIQADQTDQPDRHGHVKGKKRYWASRNIPSVSVQILDVDQSYWYKLMKELSYVKMYKNPESGPVFFGYFDPPENVDNSSAL